MIYNHYLPLKEDTNKMLSYRWVHKEKHRYYRIIISKDLLGDWVLTRVWGGINQKSGRAVHFPCSSFADVERFLDKIKKTRKQRGYELCEEKKLSG